VQGKVWGVASLGGDAGRFQTLAKDCEPFVVFDCRIRRPPRGSPSEFGSGLQREAAPVWRGRGCFVFLGPPSGCVRSAARQEQPGPPFVFILPDPETLSPAAPFGSDSLSREAAPVTPSPGLLCFQTRFQRPNEKPPGAEPSG
jgi:hypothetical protein